MMVSKKKLAEDKKKKDRSDKEKLGKGKSTMPNQPLTIHGIAISRRPPTEAAPVPGAILDLAVDVENPGDQPLYVWATCREYAYDPVTRVLSVDLAEPDRQLPPYIKMISDHPRTPAQVVVNPKSRATIKVQVPAKVNRPGPPGGATWVEDPIGQIDRVEIRIQHATEPIHHRAGENPPDFRKRMREHGEVVRAEIAPTQQEKEK
jgi:hypothetical protein